MKLLRLYQLMLSNTDENHGLSIREIQNALQQWDITVDRKTLYDDFEALKESGLEIELYHEGNNYDYRVVSKKFELPELKLLVDAIQSSKFITASKSRKLIQKLTSLTSRYEAAQLNRQVIVAGRIKTMNESIYYNVDAIQQAITASRKITFVYMQWNEEKKLVPRKNTLYKVSPWALTWNSENYYLVAYDDEDKIIKNYRVDKMRSICVTDERRKGQDAFSHINMAEYTKEQFGMFHGDETAVQLRFSRDLLGVMIDRFGKDILIVRKNNSYETTVMLDLSNNFFGWITGLGTKVQIIGPEEVVKQYKDHLLSVMQQYYN